MRILSWIFQPVYLIFFVIIAALYIYRAEIIPEHRDIGQSRVLIARMEQSAAAIAEARQTPQAEITSDTASNVAETPLMVVVHEAPQQTIESIKPTVVEPLTQAEAEPVVTSKIETQPEVVMTEEASAVEDVTQNQIESMSTLGELWYAARRAAWSGDLEQAVEHYHQLTTSYPRHADGFGELGNIYYAQGDLERAIGLYRQALDIYQASGEAGLSLQLQRVITGVEQERSE